MKYAGKKTGLMPGSNNETTKKTGNFRGKSNRLGGGGRAAQLKSKGFSGGLIAYIGRKKYGKSKFQSMATAGKRG